MVVLGLLSVIFAGFMLYQRRDIKRLFAYSSIEHMGLIAFAFGMGGPVANFAGLLHMTMHSLTKSAIFFAIGHIAQVKGTQKLAEIRGITETHPLLGWGLVVGVATALFGLSTSFGLSYILFGLTGAGDTVSTVIRGTLRQLLTPDHLRGRMTSVNMVFFMGGPQLGELEAGLVASLFGAPVAIFTGGLATVLLTALIAWRYPRLRNYTSDMADDLSKQAAA